MAYATNSLRKTISKAKLELGEVISSQMNFSESENSQRTESTNFAIPIWTESEEALLVSFVDILAENSRIDDPWLLISSYFLSLAPKSTLLDIDKVRSKSPLECENHWKALFPEKSIATEATRSKISNKESALCKLVWTGNDTKSIATLTVDEKQKVEVIKSPKREQVRKYWTVEEKALISLLQAKYGNKWKRISQEVGNNRSATEIKNYWHNLHRKPRKKQMNQ